MPALVGFVQVPVGQIEYPTAVVVDEVPHGPFDLVLDQLDVALVALVQNPAAEEPERRYEAALAKPLGHVVVECDARYEGTVPVLIRSRCVPHEALRITDRGRQQRVTGYDSRVENRNSRRSVGWTRRGLQRVNVREHQRPLEPDSRRQIQVANIPMAKQVFGQSTPTANPVQRQVGLAHRVENLPTALRRPALERAAQPTRFIAPLERPEFGVHNEGLLIGKPVALQCPAHPIVGGPAIDVLQRVQHLSVRNMLTGCKARESGFERCELLIIGERQKQRILLLADHLDVAGGFRDVLRLQLVGQRDLDEAPLVVTADVLGGGSIAGGVEALPEFRRVPSRIIRRPGGRETTPGRRSVTGSSRANSRCG